VSSVNTDRGIVLRRTKYSEHDLIVQILLASGRKRSFMAKSALRSKIRFGGGALEPTVFLQFEYTDKGSDKLALLKQANVIEDFHGLRNNYDRMDTALQLILAVSKISLEGDEHGEGLFNLLGHSLRALQKTQEFEKFKAIFYIKLLFQQGVLEIDEWMKPWLRLSIRDWDKFESSIQLNLNQMEWIKKQLNQYLETASV
jgi:DNA repair protein RecO (recombination protein O)